MWMQTHSRIVACGGGKVREEGGEETRPGAPDTPTQPGEMNPDDFKRYNNFLLYYIALNSEATVNNVLIELDINTVE